MIRVRFDRLTKRYDRDPAVDDASLELPAGEVTVLLGPSRSGKTTLARLLAGLERADEGEIYFEDKLVQERPPEARNVGFVFQSDALWPRLTIAENLDYVLKLSKVPRAVRKDRIAESLNAVKIDTLSAKLPDQLSPLQRQKASLARALVSRPDFVILDEPSGTLEPRVRDEFRDEILRAHAEQGLTTLVLSTDPREALALSNRLALIDLGRIVQVGTPAEVYNRPVDMFSALMLGPTNRIQGQVEGIGSRGEAVVRTPFGRLIGQVSAANLPSGTPVTLSIRPESLVIGTTVPQGSNRFNATIERLVFLGETRQVHLRGFGDWPIIALALQSQSQSLREGQSITLSVPPEQVVVLVGKHAMIS